MGVIRVNPPLPAITGDVLLVSIRMGEITKTPVSITYPVMAGSFGAGSVAANMAALLVALDTGLTTLISACLPPTGSILSYEAVCVNRNDVPDVFRGVSSIGTAGATSLPNQMGVVIRRGVVLKGQSGRGRLTMPFIPNTFTTPATDPNAVNAAGLTAYNALRVALFGNVSAPVWAAGTQTFSPCIFTRPAPPATVVTLAGLVLPVYCSVDPILGTQRRRKEAS